MIGASLHAANLPGLLEAYRQTNTDGVVLGLTSILVPFSCTSSTLYFHVHGGIYPRAAGVTVAVVCHASD